MKIHTHTRSLEVIWGGVDHRFFANTYVLYQSECLPPSSMLNATKQLRGYICSLPACNTAVFLMELRAKAISSDSMTPFAKGADTCTRRLWPGSRSPLRTHGSLVVVGGSEVTVVIVRSTITLRSSALSKQFCGGWCETIRITT